MLKSTYKAPESGLPLGWTEHKAPSGHIYYFHAETKRSTYKKPQNEVQSTEVPSEGTNALVASTSATDSSPFVFGASNSQAAGHFQSRPHNGSWNAQQRPRRNHPRDRPRSKHVLLDCKPWVVIKTKLGRRFFYNPERNESFWTAPQSIQDAVNAFDSREKEAESTAVETVSRDRTAQVDDIVEEEAAKDAADEADAAADEEKEEDDEDDEEEADEPPSPKRLRPDAPREFNEDDIAYQLAAMGADYGLDPGEYGNADDYDYDLPEGAEGEALTSEQADSLFSQMLTEHGVDPFMPWDRVIQETQIVDDTRYVVLETGKARKKAWVVWAEEMRAVKKEEREREVAEKGKEDPRVQYLAFLSRHATPKLYWPEFKRKYKKEPEMKDMSLPEKDKEKLYRDLIGHLKKSTASQKSDLKDILASLSLRTLSSSTSLLYLPTELVTDLRYVALDAKIRDPMIEAYIASLGPPPDSAMDFETDDQRRRREKQERVQSAMEARERDVEAERSQRERDLAWQRRKMEREEQELADAMKVGKAGLRAQLIDN